MRNKILVALFSAVLLMTSACTVEAILTSAEVGIRLAKAVKAARAEHPDEFTKALNFTQTCIASYETTMNSHGLACVTKPLSMMRLNGRLRRCKNWWIRNVVLMMQTQTRFNPSNGLPVLIDHTNPKMPFVLSEEVQYHGPLISITVPKGFRHDGASIPRVLWALMPRVGRWSRAALIHDYFYANGIGAKQIADAVFYDILKFDNVGGLRCFIMWKAVSWFGRGSF